MLGRGATIKLLRYSTQAHKAALIDGTDALEERLRSNELLKNLKCKYQDNQFQVVEDGDEGSQHLNCDKSLPMTVFPKQEIFDKVMRDNKVSQWRKPLTQWFRLGVHMMKYYKDGLRDTYRVAKDTRNLVEKCELDPKTPLVTQLCKLIEFNEIATRQKKDATALPLTRKQSVMYHRRAQVWKLPTFFILALIFEEFTAVVCYVFPKLAPHNCLTPGAYQKVCRTHTNDVTSWNPIKYQSPYTISKSSLFHILRRTPVAHISKWKLKIYDTMNIRKNPSETLMRIHQYLFIDDWFLLKDIMDDNPTLLSRKELVNCIFERQLFSADEDLNKMVNEEEGRRLLIWRLFAYWSFRFDGTVTVGGGQLFVEKWGVNNVAILNYSGLVGNKQLDKKIYQSWRSNL
ncbi:Pnt1p TDEL_0A06600 [Torulaspora delbrueckii]|uniref:Letm1 RBD domain-containing protein n=1 Tax=Torulaspora delbrueckii TaxID=4950 RepID=G8ZMZ8_TORDE|nr:hypothetical protein TDEL_0A06600 [Torulaspora delbrueckii]CCE89992.1 hypothetical protein TDEL_0A06600 [Torulaspora delbrueckii]